MATTGIAAAMKFFGKKRLPDGTLQGIAAFKEEWDEVPTEGKAQILTGLGNGSLTY